MRLAATLVIIALLTLSPLTAAEPGGDYETNWPQWRGPKANGVAPYGNPPSEWSETKNVKWKVEIPGKGSATPIIWGDTIFVSSAIPVGEKKVQQPQAPPVRASMRRQNPAPAQQGGQSGRRQGRGPRGVTPDQIHQFALFAISRQDGTTLWKKVLREELPHEGTHPTGTWASGSPLTDGKHIWAFFGSRGLFCLDTEGNLVWEVDLGDMQIKNSFGEGTTPTVAGDFVVVNWDHEGQSFIAALNKHTGKEVWRTNRDEGTSWSTPYVVEHNGIQQVVTSATSLIRSYNLEDGSLIWECEGMTSNVIPSPVSSGGMVYLTSGYRGNSIMAIRLEGAEGNITGTNHIAWSHDKNTPYVPSPLLFDDSIYFLSRNSGILSSFDVNMGQANFGPERLKTSADVYASPVGAAGKVYIVDREGTTVVLEHGAELKTLSINKLDDGFDASPAIVGNELYLRGKSLYRISED